MYHMHEVTPSAVAMADSTLMAVWIANFQNVLFFMVQNFNVSCLILKGSLGHRRFRRRRFPLVPCFHRRYPVPPPRHYPLR